MMIGFALTIEVGIPAGVSYFVVVQAVGGVLVQRVDMPLWILPGELVMKSVALSGC